MKHYNFLYENEFGCLMEIIEETGSDAYTLYKMIDFENTKNTSILLDKKEAAATFLAFTTLRKLESLKIEVFQNSGWGRVFLDDTLKMSLSENYIARWSGSEGGQIATVLAEKGIPCPYCHDSNGVGVFINGELWELNHAKKNAKEFSESWQLNRINKAVAVDKIFNDE